MVRTQIQLTERQARELKKIASRQGVSTAALIRRSVDKMLAAEQVLDDDEMGALLAGTRHGPTLVDCLGLEIIRRHAIQQAFAYGRHFESRGFELLGQR